MRKYPLYILSREPDEYGQIGTAEPDVDILAAVYVLSLIHIYGTRQV